MKPDRDQGSATEQALIAARPEPERLPPGRVHAVFERALTASHLRQRRRRRCLFLLAAPAAAAAVLCGWLAAPDGPTGAPAHVVATGSHPWGLRKAERSAAPRDDIAVRNEVYAPSGRQRRSFPSRSVAAARLAKVTAPAPVLLRPLAPIALTDAERLERRQIVVREPEARSYPNEPGGHLLVVVTGAPPLLEVAARQAPEETPGYAQAAAVRPDANQQPMWTQCTISPERKSPEVVLIARQSGSGYVTETHEE